MWIDKEKIWGLYSMWFGELYFLKCPAWAWASETFFWVACILVHLRVSLSSWAPPCPQQAHLLPSKCHSGPCFRLRHSSPKPPPEALQFDFLDHRKHRLCRSGIGHWMWVQVASHILRQDGNWARFFGTWGVMMNWWWCHWVRRLLCRGWALRSTVKLPGGESWLLLSSCGALRKQAMVAWCVKWRL